MNVGPGLLQSSAVQATHCPRTDNGIGLIMHGKPHHHLFGWEDLKIGKARRQEAALCPFTLAQKPDYGNDYGPRLVDSPEKLIG